MILDVMKTNAGNVKKLLLAVIPKIANELAEEECEHCGVK
jgi:hypothetical protein